MNTLLFAVVVLMLSGFVSKAAEANTTSPRVVVYGSPMMSAEQTEQMYPFKLLAAALKASGGNYQLKPASLDMVQSRVLKEIELGNVDVYWSMTSIEREKQLLPVRIPLDKGLNGWRILLLAADQSEVAAGVHSLKNLRRLTFLQAHDWPDTEILRFNQLKVLTAPHPQQLFEMLAHHRASAFPRAVIDIAQEQRPEPQRFVMEQQLVVHYPSAVYFFFNKAETELAADVEKGLHILRKNGEFDRLFMQRYGAAIESARLSERHVIELQNPLLPVQTPLADESLWYQPVAGAKKLTGNSSVTEQTKRQQATRP